MSVSVCASYNIDFSMLTCNAAKLAIERMGGGCDVRLVGSIVMIVQVSRVT